MDEVKRARDLKVGDTVAIKDSDRGTIRYMTVLTVGRKFVTLDRAKIEIEKVLPCAVYHGPESRGCADTAYASREQLEAEIARHAVAKDIFLKTTIDHYKLGAKLYAEADITRLQYLRATIDAFIAGEDFPMFKADGEGK